MDIHITPGFDSVGDGVLVHIGGPGHGESACGHGGDGTSGAAHSLGHAAHIGGGLIGPDGCQTGPQSQGLTNSGDVSGEVQTHGLVATVASVHLFAVFLYDDGCDCWVTVALGDDGLVGSFSHHLDRWLASGD